MARSTGLLSLLLVAATAPASAQGFEGTIVTQTYSGGKPRGEMVASYRGSTTRIDMARAGGRPTGYMLIEAGSSVWTTVMPAQKTYTKMDLKAIAKDPRIQPAPTTRTKAPTITKTGASETIAGFRCDHVVIESQDGSSIDMCIAKGLGFFGMFGGSPGLGGQATPGAIDVPLEYCELVATYKDGFQPLKVERVKGSARETIMEVTRIEKKKLDPATFEVPAGFKEFDLNALMKKLPIPAQRRPPTT